MGCHELEYHHKKSCMRNNYRARQLREILRNWSDDNSYMGMNLKIEPYAVCSNAVKFKGSLLQKNLAIQNFSFHAGEHHFLKIFWRQSGVELDNHHREQNLPSSNAYRLGRFITTKLNAPEWRLGMFLISNILNKMQLNSNNAVLKIGWYIFFAYLTLIWMKRFRLRFRFLCTSSPVLPTPKIISAGNVKNTILDNLDYH